MINNQQPPVLLQDTFYQWEQRLSQSPLFRTIATRGPWFFVPQMEFFVGTFKDILYLLAEKFGGTDELGEEIAEHAEEDSIHWKWYFNDLATLRQTGSIPGILPREVLWGPEAEVTRMASHRLTYLAQAAANPFEAMLLIEVMEFAYKVFIEKYQKALLQTSEYGQLTYFGAHHIQEELGHSHEKWTEQSPEVFMAMVEQYAERYGLTEAQLEALDKQTNFALSLFEAMWQEWATFELHPQVMDKA